MTALLVIHITIVVFLIGIILMQRSSSDGVLGAGSNPFMSGRGQANFLTRITAILATGFIVMSLVLAIYSSQKSQSTSIVDQIGDTPASEKKSTDKPAEKSTAPTHPIVPMAE